ncbi:MAG: helix-turn-helix transcriptional regulator, partial [Caulobacteraceae bacterium]|nr:helix-turn-helix transcriptional regulator [Caulobacteraceae bacterium]
METLSGRFRMGYTVRYRPSNVRFLLKKMKPGPSRRRMSCGVLFSRRSQMAMDSLDPLLVTLDVAVEAFAICEVGRGARLVCSPVKAMEVHYVLDGTMYLTTPGAEPLICGPGSLVIIPPGIAQIIAAEEEPGREVIAKENCSMTRDGLLLFDAADGRPGDLRIFCGKIITSSRGALGALDSLTEPIAEDLSGAEIVRHAFAIMLHEAASPGLGARALMGALMKTCLVMALRRYFDESGPRSALVSSLRDPRLGKAVMAVLNRPADPHSVALLAGAAGMSRSAFARAFSGCFAMTPMEFVAKVRLHHAAEILRSTKVSIKVISASIGFASRSHFSRAFRSAYGTDPRSFRKGVAAPAAEAWPPPRGSADVFG